MQFPFGIEHATVRTYFITVAVLHNVHAHNDDDDVDDCNARQNVPIKYMHEQSMQLTLLVKLRVMYL